ncbi:glycoside hydrolase family 76 protein [Xylaria sp. CBS 124048]|nr:glycoside hydrolase family 76 protein [Xylaria sp. CBS 124048]
MSCLLREASALGVSLLLASALVHGYVLDVESPDSIRGVAKQLATDLLSMYNGNQPGQIPGLLSPPYYWWEGGALMGALVDYWYYTGDTTYNNITQQGMLHQAGPYNDFMPPNQTLTEGNDDQGFWGMAAMSAAEYNFQNPPSGQPQWLALAQAVFNTQAARWDTAYCKGGLRWQIFTWNNGFDYKNSISQACFFNIGARLALYTGNSTYAEWAAKTWDWMVEVKFIDELYRIYDGASVQTDCVEITPYEFSYNVGAFLLGAAAMVEYSGKAGNQNDVALWHERVDGLLNSTELIFFFGDDVNDKVMIEIACEPVNLCDVDQMSFKAYLSRWMAATTKWAPWTFDRIKRLLQNSAAAAIKQCTGGDNGRMCGLKWANNSGQWDGTTGVGQQMAVMEVVLANMIEEAATPFTNDTGGTSEGNPSAGGSDAGHADPMGWLYQPVQAGDRAGAAFLTFVALSGLTVALVFMISDESKTTRENWDAFRSTVSSNASNREDTTIPTVAQDHANAAQVEKGKGMAHNAVGSGNLMVPAGASVAPSGDVRRRELHLASPASLSLRFSDSSVDNGSMFGHLPGTNQNIPTAPIGGQSEASRQHRQGQSCGSYGDNRIRSD